MTPEEIEKTHKKIIKKLDKAMSESIELMKSIKDICHHPKHYHYIIPHQNDDGYGRWWTTYTMHCKICGQEVKGN